MVCFSRLGSIPVLGQNLLLLWDLQLACLLLLLFYGLLKFFVAVFNFSLIGNPSIFSPSLYRTNPV
jgi:hypothetical protein